MTRLIKKSANPRPRRLTRGAALSSGQSRSLEGFSPPPGWARAHPELALRMLYIAPQDAPWVDEVFG